MRRLILVGVWGGIAALCAAAMMPWMQVPLGFDAGKLTTTAPAALSIYRIGCLLVGVTAAVVVATFGLRGDAVRRMATLWLVAVLLFPYFAITWDPRLASQASWLQMQHENLTWLGGDIYTGSEFAEAHARYSVYPVDPPRRMTIFRVPSTPPWGLDVASVGDLLEWLGYTETFCQFCRAGWFLALFGTATILAAACVIDRTKQRRRVIRSIRLMALVAVMGAAVAWTLPLVAGWRIAGAEESARAGDYDAALRQLESASALMPVLRHDTCIVAQTGKLDFLLGRQTAEAELYFATRLEAEGRFAEAADRYRSLMHEGVVGSPVRRESCRALLRSAIHDLNSGRTDTAERDLREVLIVEPTNLKANYTLQLACVRAGRREELAELVDRFARIYSAFQALSKDSALSFAHSNRMAASLDADEASIARSAYRKSVHP
jgi:tetratricopeptide (TPR) repeat protein